mgnify:CR=1 FL=1
MAIKAWKAFSEHFFKAAEKVRNTIEYTENDVNEEISKISQIFDKIEAGDIYN